MRPINHYHNASATIRQDGAQWYPDTRAWCGRLAWRYGVPLETAAAIVAVLSQRMTWRANRREAVRAMQGKTPKALNTVRAKVSRLLAGERPAAVISGNKIRAFWYAIMGDTNAVVIDSWMMKAYASKKGLTKNQYSALADIIRRDARTCGAEPSEYQAIIWVMVRGAAH